MGGPLLAARNVLKGWLLLVGVCAALGGIGWLLGGYRLLSVFVFCGLLLALGTWWYSDRIALGMLRARELPVGGAPGLHSTVERLALRAEVVKPRLFLMPDSHPRSCTTPRPRRADPESARGRSGNRRSIRCGLLPECRGSRRQ